MNHAVLASINEELAKRPRAHQQAVAAFDWQRKCAEIGEAHSLLDDEITGLQAEVALVLLGLSDLRTLHRYIDDEIAGTGWQEIERYVVEQVISPIAAILDIITKHDGAYR